MKAAVRFQSRGGNTKAVAADKKIYKIEKFTDNVIESMNKEGHNYVS